MEIAEFEWDDDNIEHIAKHGVLPDEIEEIALLMINHGLEKAEMTQGICSGIP